MPVTPQNESVNTTSSKKHFEVLDGLRGVAAISVVVYHLLEVTYSNHDLIPMGHAFLAVDFFFCLSGFVIGYAYDTRMKNMGTTTFFRNRLIRLHPMVILGSVLGLIQFLFDPFNINSTHTGAISIAISFVCSMLLIPTPKLIGRGEGLFPLNGVAWSLFMEYAANFFYALVLYKIKRSLLTIFTTGTGMLLVYVSWHRGTINLGWASNNVLPGFTRVAYSFSVGLLIYRYGLILKSEVLGFVSLSVLLILIFIIPYFPFYNWLVEAIIILFIFPLIVLIGTVAEVKDLSRKWCVFFGEISYPLYMIHFPIIILFGNYFVKEKPVGWELALLISGITIILTMFSYLTLKYYDEPVRAWLRKLSAKNRN